VPSFCASSWRTQPSQPRVSARMRRYARFVVTLGQRPHPLPILRRGRRQEDPPRVGRSRWNGVAAGQSGRVAGYSSLSGRAGRSSIPRRVGWQLAIRARDYFLHVAVATHSQGGAPCPSCCVQSQFTLVTFAKPRMTQRLKALPVEAVHASSLLFDEVVAFST
jgi:hypothetical protein